MRLLILNGPNINMLGIREPHIYGNKTYKDLVNLIKEYAKGNNIKVKILQSNYEGELVTMIQKSLGKYDGIIINPGAYTHTSIAILDALKSVNIPYVEVHISDVSKREDYRQISYIRKDAKTSIIGKGLEGYIEAIKVFQ